MRRVLILPVIVLLTLSSGCGANGDRDAAYVREAHELVDNVVSTEWKRVRANFSPEMEDLLSERQLADGWAAFVKLKGSYRSQGADEVVKRPGFTVINIVLNMRSGPAQARVTFNSAGKVAGLYFLNADVPVPG